MYRIVWLIFFLSVAIFSNSQSLHRPPGSGHLGIGAYSNHHVDAFSINANQAAIAQLNNATAGVYGEKRFLLTALNNFQAIFIMPTSSGTFGLNSTYFGFSDYNETQLGLAYARKLGDKINIGAQFNFNGVKIAGYGNSSALSMEAGVIFHVTGKLHTGIHVNNPTGAKFRNARSGSYGVEELPSIYMIGFGLDASEKFFFGLAIEKEEDAPVNVNAGFQYKFLPQLLVRAGVHSGSSQLYFSVDFSFRSYRVDVTSSYHPQLGFTPGLRMLCNFKRETP